MLGVSLLVNAVCDFAVGVSSFASLDRDLLVFSPFLAKIRHFQGRAAEGGGRVVIRRCAGVVLQLGRVGHGESLPGGARLVLVVCARSALLMYGRKWREKEREEHS